MYRRPRCLHWILLAFALGLTTSWAGYAGLLHVPDRWLFDRLAIAPAASAEPGTALIAIDEASLQALGPWPWPRGTHARLLDQLRAAGSGRVALDLDLSASGSGDPAGDAQLAAAIRRHGAVLLPVVPTTDTQGLSAQRAPLPAFAIAAAALGHAGITSDDDGRTRSLLLRAGPANSEWPALSVLLAGISPPIAPATLAESPYAWEGFHPVLLPRLVATDMPRYSYHDVLAGRVAAGQLRGRPLVIGTTGFPLATPIVIGTGQRVSPAEFHAMAAARLQQRSFLIPLAPLATAALGVVLPLLVAAAGCIRRRWRWPATVVASLLPIALAVALTAAGYWFAPAAALLAIAILLLGHALSTGLQLWHLRGRDSRTGLANAARFERALAHALPVALRHGEPLGVAVLALDGATAADAAILQATGAAIGRHVRRPRDVAAHLGEGRFGLVLPGTGRDGAIQLIQDLQADLRPVCTLSAGVVAVEDGPAASRQVLMAAEAALEKARALGGDGYVAQSAPLLQPYGCEC